ncbi:MAG: hypothetical protein OXH79_17050 [Boseongicola sp.]|nr:hypothetical protein [Boseongicola sp.]
MSEARAIGSHVKLAFLGVKRNLEEFSPLTVYSTGFRYPTASGKVMKAPDEDVTRKWIEQATELIAVLVRQFQVDVTNDDAVAGSTSPFRSKDPGKINP